MGIFKEIKKNIKDIGEKASKKRKKIRIREKRIVRQEVYRQRNKRARQEVRDVFSDLYG